MKGGARLELSLRAWIDSLTEIERFNEFPSLQMSQSQQKKHKGKVVKEATENKKGFGG
ncbi:hypothetical protein V6N12_060222 [Hibiscus sabdariffa]|uniref:Uncharacterized protein n=1 Tax=Hibiscus sabdariffa TaxID=183260 RepID=A0ABR2D3U3_9ROSI